MSKKGIPLDHKALVVGLMVVVIITFQQIAVLIITYFLNRWGLGEFESKLYAYIFSLLIIVYYVNRTIESYNKRRKQK